MTKKGIDVSVHNGSINWAKVKESVDFVLIRAGYSTQTDAMFLHNSAECQRLGIPYGVYWFSYAISKGDAVKEAKKCLSDISGLNITYPVCFDFEYDSDNYYYKKTGKTMTANERAEIADAFLSEIKKVGYTACIYTNVDYLNKGFAKVAEKYDLWLAHWGVSKPSKSCAIWQSSDSGKINGISGFVDIDYCYKDYTSNKTNTNELEKIKDRFYDKYYAIAVDVIAGKYGNGEERKRKMKEKGYDYEYAQAIVNELVK